MNREQWLMALMEQSRWLFKDAGWPLPKNIRIGVGWPSKRKSKTLGEHWHPDSSVDAHHNIVISMGRDNTEEVAGTLIHELVHAATPGSGHKGDFVRCAMAMGLIGKPTECGPGPELQAKLAPILKSIGGYPHGAVTGSNKKKQGTRLLKLLCTHCGYKLWTSQKWIELGLPSCCCGAGTVTYMEEGEGDGTGD